MTAYEFTRFDADFTSKVKVQRFMRKVSASEVAQKVIRKYPTYKKDKDYNDSKHVFIECTMSCDEYEAKNWMEYWMANAIAYGMTTKNLDWRTKFMAAWDIWNSIAKDCGLCSRFEEEPEDDEEYEYTPSATRGDYSPRCPWNAPGMSMSDFI